MHKFLKSIGFSDFKKKDLEIILNEIIARPQMVKVTKDSEGNEFAELSKEFATNVGITVRGNYLEGDLRAVDTGIKRLREKLKDKASYINTVRGVGYKYERKEEN